MEAIREQVALEMRAAIEKEVYTALDMYPADDLVRICHSLSCNSDSYAALFLLWHVRSLVS